MHSLTICERGIRADDAGRYCLNDLHRAAGGEARHQPANWLRLDTTRELVAEVVASSDVRNPVSAKKGVGTFACKELVYAFAMWVSPVFHLNVIRAFDQMASSQQQQALPAAIDARLARIERAVAAQEVKAAALDLLTVNVQGAVCLTEAAKLLHQKPRAFQIWLSEASWIFRAHDWGTWQAFQRRIDDGHLCHVMVPIVRSDGRRELHPQVKVTPAGLHRLAELLAAESSRMKTAALPPPQTTRTE